MTERHAVFFDRDLCDKCKTPMVEVKHWITHRKQSRVMKCLKCGYNCLIIPCSPRE